MKVADKDNYNLYKRMFTINIKDIRKEYSKLLALAVIANDNILTDVTTKAKSITDENIFQTFSDLHGRMINVTTKNIGNLIFVIILDDIKNKLEISPTIAIKDPNGKVILTWNIKDEFVTFNTINL